MTAIHNLGFTSQTAPARLSDAGQHLFRLQKASVMQRGLSRRPDSSAWGWMYTTPSNSTSQATTGLYNTTQKWQRL